MYINMFSPKPASCQKQLLTPLKVIDFHQLYFYQIFHSHDLISAIKLYEPYAEQQSFFNIMFVVLPSHFHVKKLQIYFEMKSCGKYFNKSKYTIIKSFITVERLLRTCSHHGFNTQIVTYACIHSFFFIEIQKSFSCSLNFSYTV